jgi:hypothetical protein
MVKESHWLSFFHPAHEQKNILQIAPPIVTGRSAGLRRLLNTLHTRNLKN